MPTISIHLPEITYKRLRSLLGRREKPSAFGRAAIEEKLAFAERTTVSDDMQRLAVKIQSVIEDEIEARIATQRLARRAKGESRTYTGEQARRALGL